MLFLISVSCFGSSRQDPTRRSSFFWGEIPAHLARHVRASFDKDLSYVVEGHASACPQTVCVDVKCVALTLIKLKYDVSASIMKCNIQFELL